MTILLTGETSQVGWELQCALSPPGKLVARGRGEMDHSDVDSIRSAVPAYRPESP